ncbi:STAS domain-containing protein [Halomonas huangheensis]|uniref:STAS domain-containing protein n=1 Tax=Halomonas huangheensis TaxID=1178482 RepID=W1N536_9GAMM|nr:STAS domain-containing protein [Halomonas huangheensis]ALM52120.1 hypothetical protein AR456_07345 [Halomonas huangheensis]ERL50682.1 hypothetical protein BJB45_05990 [Halomonas huangheensis]
MKELMTLGHARLCAEGSTLRITGRVGFEGAATMAEAGCDWLRSRSRGEAIVLDLEGVEEVSSAALSMMLEWQRALRHAGLVLSEVRLSSVLAQLTSLSGLEALVAPTPS